MHYSDPHRLDITFLAGFGRKVPLFGAAFDGDQEGTSPIGAVSVTGAEPGGDLYIVLSRRPAEDDGRSRHLFRPEKEIPLSFQAEEGTVLLMVSPDDGLHILSESEMAPSSEHFDERHPPTRAVVEKILQPPRVGGIGQ